MPSSPNYVRDYKQEYAQESEQRRHERAMRNRARRAYEKAHGKIPAGYDVDHRTPLSKGGSNSQRNLGLQSSSSNRSYPRRSDGSMKSRRD